MTPESSMDQIIEESILYGDNLNHWETDSNQQNKSPMPQNNNYLRLNSQGFCSHEKSLLAKPPAKNGLVCPNEDIFKC